MLHEQDTARAGVLNNLGSASQLWHLSTGDPVHLEDAATYYRRAASYASFDDPDLVLYLCNLALALTDHASRTNDPDRAEEAVRAARRATEQVDESDRRRTTSLVRLGNALKLHARLAHDTDSDDESVEVFREAARGPLDSDGSTPAHRSDSPELLINLGSALLRRHERGGSAADLDEGIGHLNNGVNILDDIEYRNVTLLHLAEALRLRFRQRGDSEDLQGSIDELLGILEGLGAGHPLTGKVTWALTSATVEHVDSTGDTENLQRTLRAITPVVRGITGDDPDRATALASFGALVRRHHLHSANAAALDTAVAAGETAAQAANSTGKHCAVLNSLVSTLITRYEHSGNSADLDRAGTVAEQARENAPEGSVPEHTAWAQLGIISAHRYRDGSRTADLETAVEMFDRALIAMPEQAPERVAVTVHQGRALRALYQRTGRRRHYRWARKALTEAAAQSTGPADQRLRAADLCGRMAAQAHRWSEALESFGTAVELLPLVTRGKRVAATTAAQQRWATITADAAACAVEDGQPERAVELLEHGREALLGELLPAASELGALRRSRPDLAADTVRSRRLLDRPAADPVMAPTDIVDEPQRRAQLAESWNRTLEEVRSESEHHLGVVPFAELSPAAEDGMVVLVNVSRYRSDALIVFAGRVMVVPLPGVTPDNAAEQAATAVAVAQQPRRSQQPLIDTMDWTWHNVVRPVLDRMGYIGTPAAGQPWPRAWWAVTGALAFLPLHAAMAASGHCALDRVVSSYTTGLRALLRGKRRPLAENPSALVVMDSMNQGGGELPLRNQTLARHWPSAEIITGDRESPESLLDKLAEHPLAHLCERSTQDPARPSDDVVVEREPQQHSLSLAELGQRWLSEAEFAYLGRCGTTSETPSSAGLTLAEALGFAGFTHVIGTLWSVDEHSGARIHADVYAELDTEDGFDTDGSAFALHNAVNQLRVESPDSPARWAAHTHVGP